VASNYEAIQDVTDIDQLRDAVWRLQRRVALLEAEIHLLRTDRSDRQPRGEEAAAPTRHLFTPGLKL
jgi:hypothetical protein